MDEYIAAISLIERLHRSFLKVVKIELERAAIHDVNAVQAVMLFNIGDAEIAVGELTACNCYLGSNVSYNLGKMIDNGYVDQTQSPHDRRSHLVKLTQKGQSMHRLIKKMHRRHAERLQRLLPAQSLENATATLTRLERLWDHEAHRATV